MDRFEKLLIGGGLAIALLGFLASFALVGALIYLIVSVA